MSSHITPYIMVAVAVVVIITIIVIKPLVRTSEDVMERLSKETLFIRLYHCMRCVRDQFRHVSTIGWLVTLWIAGRTQGRHLTIALDILRSFRPSGLSHNANIIL